MGAEGTATGNCAGGAFGGRQGLWVWPRGPRTSLGGGSEPQGLLGVVRPVGAREDAGTGGVAGVTLEARTRRRFGTRVADGAAILVPRLNSCDSHTALQEGSPVRWDGVREWPDVPEAR